MSDIESGITCLKQNKYNEAEQMFLNVLKTETNFPSFEELNDYVKSLSSGKQTLKLSLSSRKALICLGILSAMKGSFKLGEDYILDAAYSCLDAGILLLAGKYYLSIPDAEVDTAFGYFTKASKMEPATLWKCDDFVHKFVNTRAVFYPHIA